MNDPFKTSGALADWAAEMLKAAGVDDLAQWRMLEYWVQVELYRAFQAGHAGLWSHLGEYEQPYFTRHPKPGSRTPWKWVDLVVAEPEPNCPKRVAWLELKDLGRSPKRLMANTLNVGSDLAALVGMDSQKTADGWEQPPEHIIDDGRVPEWSAYAAGLRCAKHLIAQIVLVPKKLLVGDIEAQLLELWRQGFVQRSQGSPVEANLEIARAETQQMAVLATARDLRPAHVA